MAELALIIGNGFDLDLGLPSKYSDFADSPEFHDLARRMRYMYHEEERQYSLVLQIQQASFNSNWFDIEEEIPRLTDEIAISIMQRLSGCRNVAEFQSLDIAQRDNVLCNMRMAHISMKQASRITGQYLRYNLSPGLRSSYPTQLPHPQRSQSLATSHYSPDISCHKLYSFCEVFQIQDAE